MYRNRPMEQDGTEEQFVTRLYDLPVVHSAVDRLGALYTGTKERNRLFRFTLETAESGLGLVVSTAKPVVAKFEKPIGTLNGIACRQLEKLEQDYPIITQPTDVVMKQTMETCSMAVKPVTDQVGSVAQYGMTKMNDAKTYTFDTIDGVKSYGVSKVNGVKLYSVNTVNGVKSYGADKLTAAKDLGARQVSRLLENQTGRALLTKVDLAIDLADTYVDKYLPEDEMHDSTAKNLTQRKNNKMEIDEYGQQAMVANKALELSYKVRRRAYNHAAKRLKTMKMRSLETVEKLQFNVNLIEYARNNLDCVKNKAYYVWDEINKDPEQLSEESTDHEHTCQNVTYERRAISTARHLTHRLKLTLAGIEEEVVKVAAFIHCNLQVEKAINLVAYLSQLFSTRAKTGLTNEDIDSVKNSIEQLRTTLTSFDASATIEKLPSTAVNSVATAATAATRVLGDVTQYASNTLARTVDVTSEAGSSVHEGRKQEKEKLGEKLKQSSDDDDDNDDNNDEEDDDDDDDDAEEEDEQEACHETNKNEEYEDQKCENHEDYDHHDGD